MGESENQFLTFVEIFKLWLDVYRPRYVKCVICGRRGWSMGTEEPVYCSITCQEK